MNPISKLTILGLAIAGLTGCSSVVRFDNGKQLDLHMIALDKHGAKDCKVQPSTMEEVDCSDDPLQHQAQLLQEQIEKIVENLEKTINVNATNKIKTELLLIVHGGMVPKADATEEAQNILKEITDYNNDPHNSTQPHRYPIFINWESGMADAYADHLYRIRQGREDRSVSGYLTAPFYFLADVGRALARLPIVYGYQGLNAIKPSEVETAPDIAEWNRRFFAESNPPETHLPAISLGDDTTSLYARYADKVTYVFPGVVKILTTPVLDVVGKSSWDNMLRRTQLLFRRPQDFELKKPKSTAVSNPTPVTDWLNDLTRFAPQRADLPEQSVDYNESTGGLSLLMKRLRDLRRFQTENQKLSVTLIGHSMGAIVLTELLKQFDNDLPDASDKSDLTYHNIVFMGAAATIKNFEDAVVPYLARHPNTRFYNLMLHPVAEENEKNYLETVPRGSLLVWIDDFAANPATLSDLTIGRWRNAKAARLFIPKEIRPQVTLKAFGIHDCITNKGKDCDVPQKHGDFNNPGNCFWQTAFWIAPNQANSVMDYRKFSSSPCQTN